MVKMLKGKIEKEEAADTYEITTKPKLIPRHSVSCEVYKNLPNYQLKPINKSEQDIKQLNEILSKAFLFTSLNQQQRNIIINAMEKKEFQQGNKIISQGEEGSCLYIVGDGSLGCTKQNSELKEESIRDYKAGDLFGELALLYNCPRMASITAQSKCVLWSLDREAFNIIVKKSYMEQFAKYNDFLKSVKLLSNITEEERKKIAEVLKEIHFQKGSKIITEGETGDMFYILSDGKAYATKKKGNEEARVMEYKVGDYFGELALLDHRNRAASVNADIDCTVLALDSLSFQRLLGPVEDILLRNKELYNPS